MKKVVYSIETIFVHKCDIQISDGLPTKPISVTTLKRLQNKISRLKKLSQASSWITNVKHFASYAAVDYIGTAASNALKTGQSTFLHSKPTSDWNYQLHFFRRTFYYNIWLLHNEATGWHLTWRKHLWLVRFTTSL